jgi:ketosteroid isomerase-like protein
VDRIATPTSGTLLESEEEFLAHHQSEGAIMNQAATAAAGGSEWESEIRAREKEATEAFMAADLETLDRLFADDYLVNSPLQTVNDKPRLFDLLKTGRIRHTDYRAEIEHIRRYGDVVVVMGNDRVEGPPHGGVTRRRFTNIWQLHDGQWRSIARHANVVSSDAG